MPIEHPSEPDDNQPQPDSGHLDPMPPEHRRFPSTTELVYYQSRDANDVDLVVFDGERHFRQSDPDRTPIDGFDPQQYRMVNRLRSHNCSYGDYPWDHWQKWAHEDGVSEDLAALGRSLIREADQHSWPEHLQRECGWDDHGAAMIRLAIDDPAAAQQRWSLLLETDGGRA